VLKRSDPRSALPGILWTSTIRGSASTAEKLESFEDYYFWVRSIQRSMEAQLDENLSIKKE